MIAATAKASRPCMRTRMTEGPVLPPRENLLIGRPRHPGLTQVRAFVIAVAQQNGCVTRNALVKHDSGVADAAQAAVVSRAVSSRLAAANASA